MLSAKLAAPVSQSSQAINIPVAVRLAGVSARKIAIAGKPDCYGFVV